MIHDVYSGVINVANKGVQRCVDNIAVAVCCQGRIETERGWAANDLFGTNHSSKGLHHVGVRVADGNCCVGKDILKVVLQVINQESAGLNVLAISPTTIVRVPARRDDPDAFGLVVQCIEKP